MCTLTWYPTPGGLRLFFNRDERRSRLPAIPPKRLENGEMRFIAPLDGDRGGTWIAVNAAGLALCLLNGAPIEADAPAAAVEAPSRGLLPLRLIDARSVDEVADRLGASELARFRPFALVALAPDTPALLARWTGGRLAIERGLDPTRPLISSSFDAPGVRASRERVFERLVRDARPPRGETVHLAYHASHEPERGPRSPCMHRPDARTVSFSWLAVEPSEVRFRYVGHAPCRGLSTAMPLSLARTDPAASQ